MIYYFFSILFGLVFGSFLNVLIYRLPKRIFFSNTRSFCPKCKYKIPFYSNIPIFSFLIQLGKCAKCNQSISIQYPLVEFLSALIWLWASLNYNLYQGVLFIWISSILMTISIIDNKTFIIPFELILSAFIGLLVYLLINPSEWKISFWGLIMGVGYLSLVFLLTSAIFNKQTLGLGDLQLIAITGMWLGPVNILLSILLSAVFALIYWTLTSFYKGFNRDRAIPFGPYLSISAIFLYILDLDILSYLTSF